MKKLLLLASTAVVFPTAGFAQSTGSVDFEKDVIVVTGTRNPDVGGIKVPDAPKPKAVLTQEAISRSTPGQTILDTINLVPGVSFQNNDAYGSGGGTLTIRGFDSTRVSLTFDGIPLNDSGNYAIYSNQQLDPELIEEVNVNLGTTDVDSPTASAVGGTVNYRTRLPYKQFGARLLASAGEFGFHRIFASIDSGEIGPIGTRAFVSASRAVNDVPFNGYGKIKKQQYNARLYQPIGSNGDFISVAGHYNQNRSNFFGSLPLRLDREPTQGYPSDKDERFYNLNYPCLTDTPQAGVVDTTAAPPPGQSSCGTEFDRRYNPSNTGNIRGNSKFTLRPGLILTIDPSFQYVKANGGGTVIGREGFRTIGGVNYTGFIGGQYYFGRDLNGDGDTRDTCSTTGGSCSSSNFAGVQLLAPSQTRTYRKGVISGLRWDIDDDHTIRASYTYDNANHRQTGQLGLLDVTGEPLDVFPVNEPLTDVNGVVIQKRDRQSYAILNQFAAEYRGEFLNDRLTVNIGARAPFFKRDLENYCYTTSAGGFIDCIASQIGATPTNNYDNVLTTDNGPDHRVLKYSKLLPNIGFVYDFTQALSGFVSYAKGISVPGTDNLYNAFFFDEDETGAKPRPELTDTFDIGLRYRSSKIQAQVSAWKTKFTDRLASAYDPELNETVYRNLGRVDKHGFDGSIAYSPIKELTVYTFGSINKSKIKENIQTGLLAPGVDCEDFDEGTLGGVRDCALTAGNYESGVPKYTYGASVLGKLGPVDIGFTAKRTGPRYIFDTNRPVFAGDIGVTTGTTAFTEVFPSKAPAYWLVNFDMRYNLASLSDTLRKTYIQMNVYNLFDKLYVGGFGGGLSQSTSTRTVNPGNIRVPTFGNPPFVQIGAPRTISGTINFEF